MNEIVQYVDKVSAGDDLTRDEARRAFSIMMKGGATPPQIAGLLVGLKTKGETVEEIIGAAQAVRSAAVVIQSPEGAIDTCGTGGDQQGTYNVSTAVAFVLAGAGVPVTKHGNKAVSSKSGSADVLEALGVHVMASPEVVQQCVYDVGMCFMMAPVFHAAMRHVAPVRQELKTRTIFNIIGPLVNPAQCDFQLLGVYKRELMEPMAEVLQGLGIKKAWVVHGADGLDELSTTGVSYVIEVTADTMRSFVVDPADLGFEPVTIDALRGGNAVQNAQALKQVLNGAEGPYRDIVVLNAAAGLCVVGKVDSLQAGCVLAQAVLDDGRARGVLDRLVGGSNIGTSISD